MNPPTKEHVEAVSRLLQACRLCGASFRTGVKTEITMPDNRTYRVDERITCWRFSHKGFSRTFKKAHTAEKLKDQILEFHVRISQEKACPRFLHS
jgi:hypothetical protein